MNSILKPISFLTILDEETAFANA